MLDGIKLLDRVLPPRRPREVYVIVLTDKQGNECWWTGCEWTADRRQALEIQDAIDVRPEQLAARRGMPADSVSVRKEDGVR